ncbi:ubiquitin-specific protease ubp1 [Kalmusia sp. IMI 367209]|nr:ubiquitin-specific protease ubp1 [Kalmusia sp. IMI 367209]
MGEFLDEDTVFRAFNDRRLNAESRTTSAVSTLLVIIVGLFAGFKALELLGYSVWLWVNMALEKIGKLRLRGGSSTIGDLQNTEMQSGGNILSRTFGLNGSSLLQKGVRGVADALSKTSSNVPPGLGNWDNSCYQNSVIQGMASLPSLRDYLSQATTEYGNLDTETTNGALFDMLTKLNDPNNQGQNFWIRGKLKSMSTFQQQDAQEYYSKILDALDNELRREAIKRRPSESWIGATKTITKSLDKAPEDATSSGGSQMEKNNSEPVPEQPRAPPNPLDGLLAQRVGCIKCGYVEGLQLIPFNCVTVSLGRNNSYDIRECLDEYTNLEHIEGVECAKCTLLKNKAALAPLAERVPAYAERLQAVEDALENDDFDDKTLVKNFKILKKNWTQSTKSRQAVIARAPKALVLHVNRSIFDEMTGAQYKNTASVSYPKVLDLGNWCLGSDVAGGEWPRDPTKSMLGDANAEPLTTSPFQYRLRAAVTHYGSHGNGHYVCYRPHASKPPSEAETDGDEMEAAGEQWWRFSDDSVFAIAEAQAHQANIFMLFYERIDDSTSFIGKIGTEDMPQPTASEDDIPPPPTYLNLDQPMTNDAATAIPLPEDDNDWFDDQSKSPPDPMPLPAFSTPSISNQPATELLNSALAAYPTPPPDSPSGTTFNDTAMSETDSDDAPSTLLTSDDEADVAPSTPHIKTTSSPHLMRTAGASTGRDGESRTNLPMVTAT